MRSAIVPAYVLLCIVLGGSVQGMWGMAILQFLGIAIIAWSLLLREPLRPSVPAKALFASNQRHASHGCVRVHNAVQFARLLADHEGKLSDFDKAMASGKESSIQVAKPIPVRLLYHSAYVENGRLVFRSDPYGWDEDLARALGLPTKGGSRAIRTHVSISGP